MKAFTTDEKPGTGTRGRSLFLDDLPPVAVRVGYGSLGVRGDLGYEKKKVRVRGRTYTHALSTHPPASVVFELRGTFSRFRCHVALNDDVPPGSSNADFSVLVDGRRVVYVPAVSAGQPAQELHADIAGARDLELKVETTTWPYSHAVWLDPVVEGGLDVRETTIVDCLGRAEITPPVGLPHAARCVATTVSPGFEDHLDDMLGSLLAHGGCADALLVVCAIGDSRRIRQVARKYGAVICSCRRLARVNPTVKSVLYSIARVISSESFVCLDADTLVLGDLKPVFAAIEACPGGTILACREGNSRGFRDLEHILRTAYDGDTSDFRRLLGSVNGEPRYPLVVNDGIFAGGRAALLALDRCIRSMNDASVWTDALPEVTWRNQFVFNLALARLDCGVELDPAYNVQLNSQDAAPEFDRGRLRARWQNREVKVLHFNGPGRNKYSEYRGLFSGIRDPLVGRGSGDAYATFLDALRGWVGRYGLRAAAWSFYGTCDAQSARVPDPSTFPLLALLHYLIRSSGCARVIETGTARGVSAACLASAVSHRQGAQVVTFDVTVHPERQALWDALPESVGTVIDARAMESIAGLTREAQAGTKFDAALLDSNHDAEHVKREFDLACQIVTPGGLILIHDVVYDAPGCNVAEAADQIQAEGYGVARLWTTEVALQEGDRLGLAVIENRRSAGKD